MRSGRPIGTCWLGMRLPWRGTSVLADAELLGAGRWARAHALAGLAAEEWGKASAVITLSFMPPEARARIPVRELLEDHRMKMAGALLMRTQQPAT
jgi:AbiV family abortive infection protein